MISFPYLKPIIILSGPTAVGKTALSISLSKEFDFEVISVDSMQIYIGMDIGTAKITSDEMSGVPHHLIDIRQPDEHYDAAGFVKDSTAILKDIHSRNKQCLLTGGTGLYYKSLLEGLSNKTPSFPEIRKKLELKLQQEGADVLHEHLNACDRESAKRIHKNDTHRLLRALEIYCGTGKSWSSWITDHKEEKQTIIRFPNTLHICLSREREEIYKRIDLRVQIMLDNGFIEEVQELLDKGYSQKLPSMNSIGYKHAVDYLAGNTTKEEMVFTMARDTRRYAKRQLTWFKK